LVTPNGTVPPHQVKNIGFLKTAGYAFLKNWSLTSSLIPFFLTGDLWLRVNYTTYSKIKCLGNFRTNVCTQIQLTARLPSSELWHLPISGRCIAGNLCKKVTKSPVLPNPMSCT
jgi:hypothetical protein